MDIVRDVLDKSVVDRNGREMGRVDALVLEPRADQPPRLQSIVIGPVALGSRLHPILGRLVSACERRMGLDANRPVQIDVADVEKFDRKIHLRLAIGDTAVAAVEQRIRGWLSRLPGSR